MNTPPEIPLTKSSLFQLLACPTVLTVTIKGFTGIVTAIQREDGSGSSFNISMTTRNQSEIKFHVRTVD